jgi:O-antigen ligase
MLLYTVWLKPNCRFRWAAIGVATPLMFGAIFLTYTRSIWMGLASTVMLLIIFCLRGTPKRLAIVAILTGGILVGAVKGPDLVAFKREYSAAETRESTYMRAAFAYVSIEMFKDKPIAGFGFNQFQIYNLPYLSDRSTDIRLESIRGYVHHNSYLSLLVDLGIVGVGLFAMVALASVMQILNLWTSNTAPQWSRGLAMIALALGSVHCIQMAFHEVSFSPIENGLLFAAIGLVVAAREQFAQPEPIAIGERSAQRDDSSADERRS